MQNVPWFGFIQFLSRAQIQVEFEQFKVLDSCIFIPLSWECVCLSFHHLIPNPWGTGIVFLTSKEKWVRGQLPQHEAVKDEEGQGKPLLKAGKGKAC